MTLINRKCKNCGSNMLKESIPCMRCGAPVCCPMCCENDNRFLRRLQPMGWLIVRETLDGALRLVDDDNCMAIDLETREEVIELIKVLCEWLRAGTVQHRLKYGKCINCGSLLEDCSDTVCNDCYIAMNRECMGVDKHDG